jgi:hypothetical protein
MCIVQDLGGVGEVEGEVQADTAQSAGVFAWVVREVNVNSHLVPSN